MLWYGHPRTKVGEGCGYWTIGNPQFRPGCMRPSSVVTDIEDYPASSPREVEWLLGIHGQHVYVAVVVHRVVELAATDLDVVRGSHRPAATSHHCCIGDEVVPATEVLIAHEPGRAPHVAVQLASAVRHRMRAVERIAKSHAGAATDCHRLLPRTRNRQGNADESHQQ